jgi:hypothetical protein
MSVALPGGGPPLTGVASEPGVAAALAHRMPHLCAGFAALLLTSWWLLASGPVERPEQRQPPPAQQESSSPDVAAACDLCSGCDASACDCACDLGDACSACDVGGCDCVAVPPGAMTHTFEAAAGPERPRCDRPLGRNAWASLGLLVPLVVMFLWRRQR